MLKRSYSFDMTGLCTRCSRKFYSVGGPVNTIDLIGIAIGRRHGTRLQDTKNIYVYIEPTSFRTIKMLAFLSRQKMTYDLLYLFIFLYTFFLFLCWRAGFVGTLCLNVLNLHTATDSIFVHPLEPIHFGNWECDPIKGKEWCFVSLMFVCSWWLAKTFLVFHSTYQYV